MKAVIAVLAGVVLAFGAVTPAFGTDTEPEEVVPTVVEEATVEVEPVIEVPVEEVAAPVEAEVVVPAPAERVVAPMTVQQTKQRCLVVLWRVKSNDVDWPQDSPQVFENTSCTTPVNWTVIFKGFTQDCSNYQGDLYVDNAKTRELIAGGHLYGPNNPIAEQWPGNTGWNESLSTRFKTDCAPPCPPYDFPKEKMWEVTWGWDFENRNGNAPKFTMDSNGGLVGVNGSAVPAYMTAGWHWLYVTTDRFVTYQFADGTERTVTIAGTSCTPSIVWTETFRELPKKTKVATNWTTPVFDCDTEVGAEVEITRDWTIKSYTRGKMGEAVETINYWTQPGSYMVTSEDVESLDCPVPPVVNETTPEPVVEVTSEKTLAHTGPSDVTPIVGFMGLGAILLGAGLMVLRRLKVIR